MIDIIEIKKVIERFKDIKDNYYDIFINYYNSLNEINDCWKTNKGLAYYNVICNEKNFFSVFIENFDDFLQLFLFLIDEYSKIGNKIYYDSSLENKYINLKNNLVSYLKDIINIYGNINLLGVEEEVSSLIELEKNKFINYKDNIVDLCEQNRDIIRKIDAIEKNIQVKVSKIDVVVISVTDVKDYDLEIDKNFDVAVTDSEKMRNIYSKIQMYINEEDSILRDINDLFISLSDCYKTDNLDVIERLEAEFIININNILKIHNLNLEVLGKEIVSVEEMEKTNINNIRNIIN